MEGLPFQRLQLSTLAISWMFLRLLLYFVKMMDFYLFQYEMHSSTGTKNLKNQDTIHDVSSGSHFVGDSLVSDTINKKLLGGCQSSPTG
ncbi:hypothetical protein KY285_014296 [Solanum tuberosum]|nr:hypothetical protein KY285_014296 [Solanum tuberosum]